MTIEGEAVRLGLIGLGEVAAVHLEAYRNAPSIAVVACAEILPDRLSRFSQQYGFKPYTDYREMLTAEPLDIVCVLTPAAQHSSVVANCAAAGIPTLCEKPLGVSVEDAEKLVAACETFGTPLFYGSSYRYLPAVAKARELITQGAIGTVTLLREQWVGGAGPDAQHAYPPSHYPIDMPGGSGLGLVDHGVHLIDIFSWLIDKPIVAAFGRGNRTGLPLKTEYALLYFDGGATGHLLYDDGVWPTQMPDEGMFSLGAGWGKGGLAPAGQWENYPGCIHVHGNEGSLRIFHYCNALFLTDAAGMRQIPLHGEPAPAQFARQIEQFAASIRQGTSPDTPAAAGLATMRVLDAIYRSAKDGVLTSVKSDCQ